ncbi:MAG: Eco57I restriction-modification methylase domain-containing protein [Bacillota bacterium]
MISENILDKSKLIAELKEIHNELVEVYKSIFEYKYSTNEGFKNFIDRQYRENGISKREQQAWNDNFCHRASYTILNKILFIRICEDKGFMLNPEDYIAGVPKDPHIGEKLSRKGLQKWANLVTNYTLGELVKLAFLDMKKSYANIILYKDDKYDILNPTIEELSLKYIEGDEETQKLILQFENILDSIVEKLDTNKFNFKYADGSILGDVYEKFMDRDTRKAIGQFYTPEFVIEFILKNTVAKADVVENPFVTVADISCGSGHFLIMAYDILRNKFIKNLEILRDKYANEIYVIKRHGRVEKVNGKDYWKEENIHYHLLKHCIYGADIDSFAVQLTTINLLLKDLDNFTDELNIIECDSLIKWEEDYEWQDLKKQLQDISMMYTVKYRDLHGIERVEDVGRQKAEEIVKLCEFWNKKYDYVVGNPPYGSKINSTALKDYYMNKYNDVHMRTIDVYNYFISRATKKLKIQLGYIIPSTLLAQFEYSNCRKYLINHYGISQIIHLGENVFDDNAYPTMILVLNSNKENQIIKILDVSNSMNNEERKEKINNDELYKEIKQKMYKVIDNTKFLLVDEKYIELMFKIRSEHATLIELCQNVSVGIASGNDRAFVIRQSEVSNVDKILLKKLLVGGDISRYNLDYSGKNILYIDRETNVTNCDRTIKHLEKFKEQLSSRREARKGVMRWFELHWPRNKELFESKKVICRQTGDELIATVDDKKHYTLNSIINIVLKPAVKSKVSEEYICALLNSRLMNFYYKLIVQEDDKAFAEVKPVVLKELPIPIVDSDCMTRINSLVSELIDINNQKRELYQQFIVDKNVIDNYISKVDRIETNNYRAYEIEEELNAIVYESFGIDKESIKIIEDYYKNKNDKSNNTVLNVERFINEHINNGLNLKEIAEKFNVDYGEVIEFRQKYKYKGKSLALSLYNYSNLYRSIDGYFVRVTRDILYSNKRYIEISKCLALLEQRILNFNEYIDILRNRTGKLKRKLDMLKDCLSGDVYTWNAYRKAKLTDKINKTFIKYYDSNYYGLAEWSDEIHKNYFLDAIEEYTVNNPNEKKARDILKLFKDLDIEDKKDYIEVIQEKIKTAFVRGC